MHKYVLLIKIESCTSKLYNAYSFMYHVVLDQGAQRASEKELKNKMIVWFLLWIVILHSIDIFLCEQLDNGSIIDNGSIRVINLVN